MAMDSSGKQKNPKPSKRSGAKLKRGGTGEVSNPFTSKSRALSGRNAKEHVRVDEAAGAAAGMDTDAKKKFLSGIATLATALWRARSKIEASADIDLPNEFRNLPRHIDSAWAALEEAGVEVNPHVGDRYVPGMAVHVISFQPDSDIKEEVVLEAVSPSVYLAGTLIQRGKVIVGQPPPEAQDCDNRN